MSMRAFLLILITLTLTACGQSADDSAEAPSSAATTDEDPHMWLEDVEGEEALAWVEEQNRESLGYLEALPTFEPFRARNLEIYDSEDRIPGPGIRDKHVYNFWRDANNIRGVWRRMSIDDYVANKDDWEIVLDIDALAEAEDEDWVWKGSNCLRPAYTRCLINLSRGGADATVVREFDIDKGEFVENGFFLPEAKSGLSWVDEDTLFVGTDFGEGSLTDSGYARTSRLWKRGVPVEEAEEIFAGEQTDVAAGVSRNWDGDTAYDLAYRVPTFFTRQQFLMTEDGEFVRIDVPEDATIYGIFKGQLMVELRSDWAPDATTLKQGSLVSIDFAGFMAGDRDFDVLFAPTANTALKRGGVATTRDYLMLNTMEDVVSKVSRLSFVDGEWIEEPVEVEAFGNITFSSADDNSNLFFFYYEGFLRPDTLYVSDDGGDTITPLKNLPSFFDADGMQVEQYFATSKDGTKVPYFLVTPTGFEANGRTPTLIGAYGGFQVSRTPFYSATIGHSWLERGGAYVLANIRGGGEYGPSWHQAGLKEKRQNIYDDFIAVAEDVIERGISSPQHLGIRGGSNGGLLTGVMLTQRPDLYNGVVVQVPLLDMKRYNKLLAGASWMAEYGNPDTDDWEFIKAYSPYHNLDPDADYPKAFFTTSTRDDRVHPAHARKMVARMREMGHDLYYYENTVGGHGGASDNKQAAYNEALIYSYLWDQLGGESG
ncbi:MAG: prolyl oligopeptidase family serine peptidase [Pseudomonadota bacterium]